MNGDEGVGEMHSYSLEERIQAVVESERIRVHREYGRRTKVWRWSVALFLGVVSFASISGTYLDLQATRSNAKVLERVEALAERAATEDSQAAKDARAEATNAVVERVVEALRCDQRLANREIFLELERRAVIPPGRPIPVPCEETDVDDGNPATTPEEQIP